MSITVVKERGVTVVTMATDSEGMLPPLCEILKTFCYSRMCCCSVLKGLIPIKVTAALGTIQIMVGLFNMGLGPGRTFMYPGDLTSMGAAYWLGVGFFAAGLMSLLAGRFPSLGLVVFAVLVNIEGSVLAITGIVLYAKDLAALPAPWKCDRTSYLYTFNCGYEAYFFQLTAMDITLIVLDVLQMCVCISFAVLGIKAVLNRKEEEDGNEVEDQEPQLKEDLLTSPGA